MKKVLLLLVCLFTLQTVVWADDDKPCLLYTSDAADE
mgnify:CR=1 FL=1